MNDKRLGSVIFVLCLAGALFYIGWLFWPVSPNNTLFYIDGMRWAILLPILVGVLAIVSIGMWIGWTMFTTPPPIAIDDDFGKEKEEE